MRKLKQRVISMLVVFLLVLTTTLGENMNMQSVHAEETKTEILSLECRKWGTSKLVQVNTNLQMQTETNKYYNFTPDTSGYEINNSGSNQQFGWAGFAENNGIVVITFNFNSEMITGQKFVLRKESVFTFGVKDGNEYAGETKYILDKDYTFIYNGDESWSLLEQAQDTATNLTFKYRWGNANVIQYNTNLPSDTEINSFVATANNCNILESGTQKVASISMYNVEGTIVLGFKFNNEYVKGETYKLEKGSIFGFNGGKNLYTLTEDIEVVFDGKEWGEPAQIQPEPIVLTYRSGTDEYIQYNTNLTTEIEVKSFSPKDNNCNLLESGTQKAGWIGMTELNGIIILTVHFDAKYTNTGIYKLSKDSVFGFNGGETRFILSEDIELEFSGNKWKKPGVEESSHTCTCQKKVVKATTTKAGSITEICECGNVKSKVIVAAASNINIDKTSITYNKKKQKVSIVVKDSTGKEIETSQYIVTGTVSAKNVGIYKIKVTLKGNYTGSKTLTWKINPMPTKVTSVKSGKKKLTVKWNKQNVGTIGYEIWVATDKNFKKNVKIKTIKTNNKTSKVITGLKKNKKYYVRIRTCSEKNVSLWTTYKKSIKVK